MTSPGWPSERQWVTIGLFAMAVFMLQAAKSNPALWEVETFKAILQAIILTGLLNMVAAFHFSANKSDETKTENTAAAFEAITATAKAGTPVEEPTVTLKPGETAQAEEAKS